MLQYHCADDAVCETCGCTEKIINTREAEVYCRQCGVVMEFGLMDMQAEYRVFASDDKNSTHDDPSRVGPPEASDGMLLGGSSLGCSIERSIGPLGNRLSKAQRRVNKDAHVGDEGGRKARVVSSIFKASREPLDALKVPPAVSELACAMVNKLLEIKDSGVAADQHAAFVVCLSYAARYHKCSLRLPRIAAEFRMDLGTLLHSSKHVLDTLRMASEFGPVLLDAPPLAEMVCGDTDERVLKEMVHTHLSAKIPLAQRTKVGLTCCRVWKAWQDTNMLSERNSPKDRAGAVCGALLYVCRTIYKLTNVDADIIRCAYPSGTRVTVDTDAIICWANRAKRTINVKPKP